MEYIKFENFIDSTQYGYTADTTSLVSGDAKYLRITDIVPYFVDKDRVPFCAIDASKVDKYLVHDGDVLIARTGATTGYNLVVDDSFNNYVFASYLIRFNYNRKKLYPRYLKYVLKSPSWYGFVNNYIGGSAQPGMNARVFGKYYLPYTDLYTQQRIASILSAYDSQIENNQKRIKLLEQMAENLYNEWFMRFRFPGYENAEFEGGMPKGWNVFCLSNYGRIETGKTPSMEHPEYYGGKYLFIKTPDMHDEMYVLDTSESLSELGNKIQPNKLLPENSIMVSCIGSAGVVAINAKPAHTNQQINSIVLKDIRELEWLYFTCKFLKPTIELFGATGATMTNLSKGKFERLKVINPSMNIKEKYHTLCHSMFQTIKCLQEKNLALIHQRDLLLPRLMSGKLSI